MLMGKLFFILEETEASHLPSFEGIFIYLSLRTPQTIQGMGKVRSVLILLYAEDNPSVMLSDGLC